MKAAIGVQTFPKKMFRMNSESLASFLVNEREWCSWYTWQFLDILTVKQRMLAFQKLIREEARGLLYGHRSHDS